ncbi:uncharacterized protein LOC126555726 [Aphis gossypii]|uniref:uncharacterized protein LOC126555726 n=1 Tax=Aphis gossypii TaxID=80765 RepID=UPI0021599A01|nr:uncharacterized protein LOC126555726 [Aphis gossypii]
MNTSNFPTSHPCFCNDRKKIPGTFTDKTYGEAIEEFIALRAKSYAYKIVGQEEKIKAKGIRGHVVKFHMTFEDHMKCLFWNGTLLQTDRGQELAVEQFKQPGCPTNEYTPFTVNISFRSYKHEMKTISTIKLALNRTDDKRVVLENQINTLAHGHFRIE